MNSSKILFVIPKTKSMFGGENIPDHPHVGIAYLSSFLKRENFQVEIFDEGVEEGRGVLEKKVKEFKPELLGLTMFSYCYQEAYDLVIFLRKKYPKIPLILGGPHVSAVRSEILKETKTDFAIYGEGEESLLSFLKEWRKERPEFKKVPNLIWRKGRGVVENPQAPLIKDLDSLPFPDFEIFNLQKYRCFQNKTLPLLTSRGCPYGCTYCSVKLSMGRGFRPRSPENVLKEIEFWFKLGFNNFDINDDCFTLDLNRAKEICQKIIYEKLKIRLQLYNGIRVDRIDLPLLKLLKKTGCTFIAYGCEAGNDRMLKIIDKGITIEQVRKAVALTNQAKINNAVNFIIGHPGETYEDALDSLKVAKSLPTNFVNFYNLVPYPGTEAFLWAKKHAKFLYPPKSFLKKISYRDNTPIYETEEFTRKEREEILKKGFALYERKVMEFRLGKTLGSIAYWLSRPSLFHDFAIDFALNNQMGRRLFLLFSSESRQ